MKKLVLFVLGFTVLTAQSQIEIRKSGETTDISGTIVTENVEASDLPLGMWDKSKFYVYNMSGADERFRVKRVRVSVPADWNDEVCWPPLCYPTSGDVFITPNSAGHGPVIYNGDKETDLGGDAEIKPQIYPGQVGSSATYRYVVTDLTGDVHYDSITLVINYVASVSVASIQKNVELTMSPNPAVDVVSISAEGIADAKIRVVDVLGNVVYTGEFNNTKKLNVSEFRNGVYFVTVQTESNKGFTKKLVVRH